MFCTKCGKQCPDGAKFCTGCGAPLTPPASRPAPAPQTPPASAPVPPPQAPAPSAPPVPPTQPPVKVPSEPPVPPAQPPVHTPAPEQPAPAPRPKKEKAPKKGGKGPIVALVAVLVVILAAVAAVFVFRGIQKGSLKNRVVAALPKQLARKVERIYSDVLPEGYELSADPQDFDFKKGADGFDLYGLMTVTGKDGSSYDVVVEGAVQPNFFYTDFTLDALLSDYDLPTVPEPSAVPSPSEAPAPTEAPATAPPAEPSAAPQDEQLSMITSDGYTYYGVFADPDAYVLPSDTQYLTEDDLAQFTTRREMNIIYNEIFARHGQEFKRPWILAYFSTKNWYYPVEGRWITSEDLSDVEQYNMELIRDYTQSHEWPDILPADSDD